MNIALITCDKLPNLTPTDQLLIPELAKHNITAQAVIWSDNTINWNDFDYLIFRSPWDYFEKETEFNNWLDLLQKQEIKTFNALEIIQQNKHKFYLRNLEKQGIPIIPTIFIDKTSALNLNQIIPSQWKKAVIKPAYSGGSYQTEVFESNEIESINQKYQPIAAEKELLLQEFMPQIKTQGETSFIFFNKKFSHALNKKPIEGEFRIQVQFGGIYTASEPSAALIQQAQKIVDTFSGNLLYARVDGIIINNQLQLMEIECLEPDLYFEFKEGSLERFVESMLELISKT